MNWGSLIYTFSLKDAHELCSFSKKNKFGQKREIVHFLSFLWKKISECFEMG